MSEIRRLSDESSNEFTRALLRSANGDRPELGACERALGVVGLGTAGALATSSTAHAASTGGGLAAGAQAGIAAKAGSSIAPTVVKGTSLLLVKWIGVGALGGALVLGMHVVNTRAVPTVSTPVSAAPASSNPSAHERASSLPTHEAPSVASMHAGPVLTPTATSTPPSDRDEQTVAADRAGVLPPTEAKDTPEGKPFRRTTSGTAAPLDIPAPRERSGSPSPAGPASTSPPAPAPLTTQLEELSSVRGALAGSDPERALVLLDDFGRRYPSSPLAEEALVLRIDALVDSGQGAQASALASTFLRSHPGSAYREHVRFKTNR